IPALPGWRYLAQAVDPTDHARVLAARPELVDGVVITDPGSHARAREALGDAALLPRSAVAVGTAAALLAPAPAADADTGDVFLVPPNPAMHDEHAADEERHALRARAAEPDDEIRALAARLAKDRELAARLASWRSRWPAGRPAAPAPPAAAARTSAAAAAAERTEARRRRGRGGPPPKPRGPARNARRPRTRPAAARAAWPGAPPGCGSGPAGRRSCGNSPTRRRRRRPAPAPVWSGPGPPTRTGAPP